LVTIRHGASMMTLSSSRNKIWMFCRFIARSPLWQPVCPLDERGWTDPTGDELFF
jgi:hypothetical protein